MVSVKSSVKKLKTAATRMAVLIVIVLQTLEQGAGWSEEPTQPKLAEEFTKQEKIYRSRGADVPEGYVTNRGLSDYAGFLSGFCDALGKLGSSDRWLDIGAGEAQAILDYYAPEDDAAPAQNCGRSGAKARAVAMSIEDRQTDNWKQQAANIGDDRIRYVSGKRLRQYSPEELGKFQIITDVYGGFSYTADLSLFVEKVLSLLETGGVFYTLLQDVHLADGKEKPNTYYLTELVDAAGSDEKVCSWLKKTTCTQVTCESKGDWDPPTEQISIRKVCNEVSVPPMKLLKFEAGNPPGRKFQLEP